VSRLTLIAGGLALAFYLFGSVARFLALPAPDPFVGYVEVWVVAGIIAVACGLSIAGAFRSRRPWGVLISIVIALLTGVYAFLMVVVLIAAGPLPGLVYCDANLRDIASASQIGFMQTGRVPRDISDLVAREGMGQLPVGKISREMVICPYDSRRQRHPEEAGSSYVLAALHKLFFDEYFLQEDKAAGGLILCAYCTIEHSRWRPARTYVTVDGRPGITSGDDLQAWVSAQAEAVTWLADEYPVSELERFAHSGDGHRREFASAILRYRLDKKEREAQRGDNRAP